MGQTGEGEPCGLRTGAKALFCLADGGKDEKDRRVVDELDPGTVGLDGMTESKVDHIKHASSLMRMYTLMRRLILTSIRRAVWRGTVEARRPRDTQTAHGNCPITGPHPSAGPIGGMLRCGGRWVTPRGQAVGVPVVTLG